ncbi:MAG: hypothetical protein AW10_02812 [Candidatus Accumulibacter appositus]|uniref:Uncharacterized protein n=1 Tax=Candidatus Accumulibacter appositus TaxID=1454003 RepID=A0A011N7S1_9PROT|nr:MAG: hypothetical protein AW10_02812 [Candidatus Accumulibacter appositus]
MRLNARVGLAQRRDALVKQPRRGRPEQDDTATQALIGQTSGQHIGGGIVGKTSLAAPKRQQNPSVAIAGDAQRATRTEQLQGLDRRPLAAACQPRRRRGKLQL